MGEYKISTYTNQQIDLFIGVDIDDNDLYILPVEFSSKYNSSVSINVCKSYKNNFDQLEPDAENSISGGDDNVESLTGNADGNDVGMK